MADARALKRPIVCEPSFSARVRVHAHVHVYMYMYMCTCNMCTCTCYMYMYMYPCSHDARVGPWSIRDGARQEEELQEISR